MVDLRPRHREQLASLRAARSDDPRYAVPVPATSTGHPQSQSSLRNRTLAGAVRRADEERRRDGLPPLPERLTPLPIRRGRDGGLRGDDEGEIADVSGYRIGRLSTDSLPPLPFSSPE